TPEGAGPGVVLRRCRDRASGLEWNSYAATSNDRTHIVEGLAAFDDALRLTLASLVEDREVPGTLEIVTTGGAGSLARALALVSGREQLIGQGYRRNNAGEYTQAEEFFRPDLLPDAALDEATPAQRQHEATVHRALQLSNLGRYEEAARIFAEARALGLRDGIQARLLRNFEAIDALNRGDLAAVAPILARPVPDPSPLPEVVDGAVEIDPRLAASLNSGLATGLTDATNQETRLTRIERAAIIDAQAEQIAATALRLQDRPDEAFAKLTRARDSLLAVKQGRVLSTARLEAQILSEMALVDEDRQRYGEAERRLRDAVALPELR